MTGLEKMVNQILQEANDSADAKIKEAQNSADAILAQAKAQAQDQVEDIKAKAAAEMAAEKEKMLSSAQQKRRTALLKAKQEIILAMLDKAYGTFCAQGDQQYFETIKKMLEAFVLPQSGEIFFSEKDLKRMPAGFEKEIASIAKAKGGSLSLSEETRPIDAGFILAYGGIEENCSFKALFDSKKDELQDKVRNLLFSAPPKAGEI